MNKTNLFFVLTLLVTLNASADEGWIKEDSQMCTPGVVCTIEVDNQYRPHASAATRYLFLAVLKEDEQGVIYHLRNGADVNHVLTECDAFRIDRLAQQDLPGYTRDTKCFFEGNTIADIIARKSTSNGEFSRIFRQLILSDKMSKEQIRSLDEYFSKGWSPEYWLPKFRDLVKSAKGN